MMAEGLLHEWEGHSLDLALDLTLGVTWEVSLEKQPFLLETDVEDQGSS